MRLEMDLATLDYSYTACVSVMLVSVVVHVSGYETTVKWAHKNANESAGICKEMIAANENHARQT